MLSEAEELEMLELEAEEANLSQQSPEQQSGFSRVLDEGAKRENEIQGSTDSWASKGLQRLGSGAQTAGELGLEAVKSTMSEGTKQGFADMGSMAYKNLSDLGNALPDVTPQIDYRFSPETQRNLGAVGNMAMSIPAVGGAKVAAETAVDLGKSAGRTLKSKIPPPSIKMNSGDIGDMAGQAFQVADHFDAQFSPAFSQKYIQELSNAMPQNAWGQATVGDNEIARLVERFKDVKDPMTVQSIKEMTEGYNKKISDSIVNGKMDSDGQDLLTAKSLLEDMAKNEPAQNLIGGKEGVDALFDAKNLWHQKSRLDLIEQIEKKAAIADNSASVRKRAYARLLMNQKYMNGFKNNPEMVKQIEKAAQTGAVVDILRESGSRLGATIIGAGAGGAFAGPVGAIAGAALGHGAAAVSRKAADAISKIPTKKLTDLIGKEALKSGYRPRKKP